MMCSLLNIHYDMNGTPLSCFPQTGRGHKHEGLQRSRLLVQFQVTTQRHSDTVD